MSFILDGLSAPLNRSVMLLSVLAPVDRNRGGRATEVYDTIGAEVDRASPGPDPRAAIQFER